MICVVQWSSYRKIHFCTSVSWVVEESILGLLLADMWISLIYKRNGLLNSREFNVLNFWEFTAAEVNIQPPSHYGNKNGVSLGGIKNFSELIESIIIFEWSDMATKLLISPISRRCTFQPKTSTAFVHIHHGLGRVGCNETEEPCGWNVLLSWSRTFLYFVSRGATWRPSASIFAGG